ncbi:cysteine-rich receptor-like protein kinase 10 [Tripterygium wilfordii]|uniref:cysteine-rich receptor-like protein kinase 10 n=1 Tax=Tripterygium wilfordii TaxID=458696 RepID=UPI0018F82CE7|nr:cysteine-rich receptor-like protein kinase 10 [Tripterygium wilfordii]
MTEECSNGRASMAPKILLILLHIFLSSGIIFYPAKAQTWIKAGYWFYNSGLPVSDINSAPYTHIICAFADLNSSSYELSVPDEQSFSNFTNVVKLKNPSITALLSIRGGDADYSDLSLMVRNSSNRASFIQSSIKLSRLYGFDGLDFSWVSANTSSNMVNMGTLFQEWRAAIVSETRNSGQSELILTAAVQYTPNSDDASFPIESARQNLNWVHVLAYDYYMPTGANFTGAFAALYDPASGISTDYGIGRWINGGIPANKLVLGLPFYGYAWTLKNPSDNGVGAPATGPAITDDASMSYKHVKNYIQGYGASIVYNATYVVNYCTIGTTWIAFDDIEVVRIKVSYAKEKDLLGYVVWQIPFDDNWVLSQVAAEVGDKKHNDRRLLVITLTTAAALVLLLGCVAYYARTRIINRKGKSKATAGDFGGKVPDLIIYGYDDIKAATDDFSIQNKLGEGGYGPVYKGLLPDGQEIAVKKLSKASTQGFEEFKNEVTLTARLQHVNLVKVLGFCIDRDEQMLIYEYMPNNSLDRYLFDPIRRYLLDWGNRVQIIEGVTQGFLYLQEYSRFTIIHRDLKPSNILLDNEMKPKISDFGMARIFARDGLEANTSRIVGTYGYAPPEYIRLGLYSTKSDVYSFGILLLQLINGKRNSCSFGVNENLSLTEYAYELWLNGEGMNFMDSTLDDSRSSCKLIRCMHIALLCVQDDPRERPSMLEVSSMLQNGTTPLAIPKKPSFSIKRDHEGQKKETALHFEICSVNDATISTVGGR